MQDLPIGISEFPELREKNRLYVDKTKFVYRLLQKDSRTFLSRPRRFGKSLLVSTLEAALQGKKELFQGLWIADSDYSWKPVGVVRFDFSQLSLESVEAFRHSLLLALQTNAKKYDIVLDDKLSANDALVILITTLCDKKENIHFESIAILIDEYDHPILHALHDTKLAMGIRDVMKNFSCVIKGQAALVKFVFVTGVSAFSKSGLSSGLNNLDNLTMQEPFFNICGYTDEEVDHYFVKHIQHWATLKKTPYEEVRQQLKNWYNGYCFTENTPTVYSPFSLTCALNINALRNFWFESATPQFLLDELNKPEREQECRLLHLEDLEGNIDLLQTFEIECIPLMSLLFQMGYLTIRDYNADTGFYRMRYPNTEVKMALHRYLVAALTKTSLGALNTLMSKLFSSLIAEDVEQAVQCLTSVFSNIPYQLYPTKAKGEKEQFYHAIVQALFIASGIKAQAEFSTSLGRSDIIVELPNLLYVIEIKVDEPPQEGIDQIERQKYYEPFLHLRKPIRLLGLFFHRKKLKTKGQNPNSLTYVTKKLQLLDKK